MLWEPMEVERLWFFPHRSEYLRYSPHWHMIFKGGFRQNLPLSDQFVVVKNGKFSIKDYHGHTLFKMLVVNHVWYIRQQYERRPYLYQRLLVDQIQNLQFVG